VLEVKQKSAPRRKENKWIRGVNNRTRGAKSTVGLTKKIKKKIKRGRCN